MLPLSIDSLNNSLWMQPHQNRFQTDEYGLCRGELQACDGTFFLLDECGMDTGTLVERGILNIKALQEAMELGKVDYGLAFGNISRDCDFRFSILGKSKSVLSPAFSMELIPNLACSQSHNVLESADVLQGLFLAMNSIKFEVDEVMMERVHSDFAKSQQLKRDAKEPTDDGTALLNRLILAENIAKSFGMTSMDVKSWEEAGSMEMQRFERVTKVLN